MDQEAAFLLLEMQNEELFAKLEKEEDAHRKASNRATAIERQNKGLRKKMDFAESEIATLEQCWNCPDLGNKAVCGKCSNNSVFIEVDGRYEWRGYPPIRRQGR